MSFFMDPEITLMVKLLEIVYMFIGVMCLYAAFKNAKDKTNPSPVGTAVFWGCLGLLMAIGRFLPPIVDGVLVAVLCVPLACGKLKKGTPNVPTAEQTKAKYDAIGMKIFAPALIIGISSLVFALIGWNALVGTGTGVLLAVVMLKVYSNDNKVSVFFNDSERYLSIVGPTCMLPILLSVLGSVFTTAGVGEVVAGLVKNIIPEGNLAVGIIVYAIGMALFTIIMGNAFAAITVMTVGIGAPFVFALGADPVVVGMLALTCGYCGTLCTPMAANFNILPVAILDIKDKFGVIKNQLIPAAILLVFQICYMLIFA